MDLIDLSRKAASALAILCLLVNGLQHVVIAQIPDFSAPPKSTQPRANSPKRTPVKRPNTATKKAPTKLKNALPADFSPPEVVSLDTKDGVKLTCTWFAPKSGASTASTSKSPSQLGTVKGETTAPFILLHDWDRSREDLMYLGRFLQLSGHAVLVPDFRGHGESLTVAGSNKPIDRTRFRKKDIATLMVDIETCKKFLMRKNDAGELNIDLLSVAAVGKSAALAMQWAISDWSWLPVGSVKQGQDVKSLILIAPEQKFKGVSIKPLLKNPLFVGGLAEPLPLLFVYGAQHPESVEETTEIFGRIKKTRSLYAKAWREQMVVPPKMPEPAAATDTGVETKPELPPIDPMKTFVDGPVPGANKSGSELIASPESQGVFRFIDQFVKQSVLSRQAAYPWQKRLGE